MISDEVRMLASRMKSHPWEFTSHHADFGDRYRVRESRNWDNLMNSIVHNKPDIEKIFNPEEISLLRETASEILRPVALATIVKMIVGGVTEESAQMEMDYTIAGGGTSPAEDINAGSITLSALDVQLAGRLNLTY